VPCPAEDFDGARYPQTPGNSNADGVCITGTGSPRRYCSPEGIWGEPYGTPCS